MLARCSRRRLRANWAKSANEPRDRNQRDGGERPRYRAVVTLDDIDACLCTRLLLGDRVPDLVHGGLAGSGLDVTDGPVLSVLAVKLDCHCGAVAALGDALAQTVEVDTGALQGLEVLFKLRQSRLIGLEIRVLAGQQVAALARFEILERRQEPFERDDRCPLGVDSEVRLPEHGGSPASEDQRSGEQHGGHRPDAAQAVALGETIVMVLCSSIVWH